MLVLSRRTDEEIVIDGEIRIKVLTNGRGKVRLGITAPDHIRIERSEVAFPQLGESHTPPSLDRLQANAELLRDTEVCGPIT